MSRNKSSAAASAAPGRSPRAPFWEHLRLMLGQPINGASLAVFRMAVGLVMMLEAGSLFRPNLAALGYGTTPLETYYTGQKITFHFPYEGFDWVPLLPAQWIHAIVAIQAIAGVLMVLGLFYRAAAAAVFLSWFYLWIVESTRTYWQSHYYLEVLLTFLLIWMPAANCWSLDSWRARDQLRPKSIPYWTLALLRGQLVIAYFYAGVAKINYDWLLDAVPVRLFLAEPGVTEPYRRLLGPALFQSFAAFVHSPGFAFFLSYAGLLFDLSIGFLLLIRRTRIFGLLLMGIFHFTNHFLIFDDIGWFPLVGFLTALIFLDPDWPQRFWTFLRRPRFARPDWKWFGMGVILFPGVGSALGWHLPATPVAAAKESRAARPGVVMFLGVWLVWQILVPLRHYFIPGDGRFTYEGMSFSWRLKTEARHAIIHQLHVYDSGIISSEPDGKSMIDWNAWHGEKILHRMVVPGVIDWPGLPEIFILNEPVIGERIVYNPAATGAPASSEAAARQRVGGIWQELYGRSPKVMHRTSLLPDVLGLLARGLRAGGMRQEADDLDALAKRLGSGGTDRSAALAATQALLAELSARDQQGGMTPLLRKIMPLALSNESPSAGSCFVVEDPLLLRADGPQINPALWKSSSYAHASRDDLLKHLGANPLVIYSPDSLLEFADRWPQSIVIDRPSENTLAIAWNSARDLTPSKLLHTSAQPFYLRRYASRVAELWQKEYGRRPVIRAVTALSLNGRPHQPLVDPNADLASVKVLWLGHNPWIRDLATARIPPEALNRLFAQPIRKGPLQPERP